jgi:hypothetical protein
VSIAVEDKIPPVLDVLREVDKTFRAVRHINRLNVTSYVASGGLRVDFLTRARQDLERLSPPGFEPDNAKNTRHIPKGD